MAQCSSEAAEWWLVGGSEDLIGRPFVGLFFFEAPAAGGDPLSEAWSLLEAAAATGPLNLHARVEGADFEAEVHLTAASAADAAEGVAYVAQVKRIDPPPPPPRVTAEPVEPPADIEPEMSDAAEEPDDDATSEWDETAAGREELDAETESDTEEVADGDSSDDVIEEPPRISLRSLRRDREAAPSRKSSAPAAASAWDAFDGGGVGLFELDVTAGTARFSDAWCALLGYESDDVGDEAETLGALFHPDDSEAAPQLEARGKPGARTPYSAEARLRGKDGAWRWMQLEGVHHFDSHGELARLTGVMLDAQESHDLEEEMLRSDERFRRLLGRGRLGFFELDLVADTATFSPEFRHALGYTAKELPATPDGFLRLLPPEDAEPGASAFFAGLVESAGGLTCRYRLQHKDGRWLTFEALLTLERNRRAEVDRVVGVHGIARDEDPAEADDAATASPAARGRGETSPADALVAAMQQALDAAAEAVVVTENTGLVTYVNARGAQWTGVVPDKIHGRRVNDFFPLHDRATGTPAPELVHRVIGGGHALELDHRFAITGPDGARTDVVITCRPLFDLRRRVAGAILILRKPSEMPLSPAELVASNRMETLGRLACGIAHDFNNVLTTVTGSISLALDKREWAPLAPAQKALETARNLARQLLTFARDRSAERKVQSLTAIIKETARLTSAGAKTAITLELPDDTWPVSVDAVQLVQVFTNLTLNAMQVMPDGGRIWIRTLNMPLGQVNSVELPPGDYVRVEVQDNGPGIPADNLAHIFEPFFSTRSGGTGLGLAMVRSIIAQHEGAIEAVSQVGGGTTFTLYLPRARQLPVKETPKPIAVPYGTGRILVMDDDADLCMVAKGMLEVLGYEADAAMTAEDALAKFRRYDDIGRRYAAVVLDLTMAGGPGGEEVLARLREIDPDVKAIVSSGYATEEHVERYRELGFTAVLAKPYRSTDLGRVLKEVLGTAK